MERHEVISAYRFILGREPENEAVIDQYCAVDSWQALRKIFVDSDEYREKNRQVEQDRDILPQTLLTDHDHLHYRVPNSLHRSLLPLKKILVLAHCGGEPLRVIGQEMGLAVEHQLLNYLFDEPPPPPSLPASEYTFQVIQPPLRSITKHLHMLSLPYDDLAAHETFFEECVIAVRKFLELGSLWGRQHGLVTFFMGLLPTQQNPMGRLLPRYDLRNIVYFVERLNMEIEACARKFPNTFYCDIDEIASTYGKKYIQSHSVSISSHAQSLVDFDFEQDQERIVPAVRATKRYTTNQSLWQLYWLELLAAYRTIMQVDVIKVIVVDLDDTLWRGIARENKLGTLEGWPIGFIEALRWAKQRGIMLAIASKNDHDWIQKNWDELTFRLIAWDDFVCHCINWEDKATNITTIAKKLNVGLENILFIDDNPREIALVQELLPMVRTAGTEPLYWRRIVLWSPEMQRAVLTTESVNKSQMMQAQLRRDVDLQKMDQTSFLENLNLSLVFNMCYSSSDIKFQRALELLNKTNQFNSTGQTFTPADCEQLFQDGWAMLCVNAEDSYTQYGLISVIWLKQNNIKQMVMSCRVFGLGIEDAILDNLIVRNSKHDYLYYQFNNTEHNHAAKTFIERHHFSEVDSGRYSRLISLPFTKPGHIHIKSAALMEASHEYVF